MKRLYELFLSRKTLLVTAILFLVVGSLGYIFYGYGDPQPRKKITRFHQFKWKVPRETIFARLGSPDENPKIRTEDLFQDSSEPGVRIIYPNKQVDGETVDIGFVLHQNRGLLKGQYHYHFGLKNDCRRIFKNLHAKLNERFGRYQVNKGQYNHMNDPFCVAVLVGKASKYAQWKLPDGTTISLVVGSDFAKRRVKLLYETPAYYRWLDRLETP